MDRISASIEVDWSSIPKWGQAEDFGRNWRSQLLNLAFGIKRDSVEKRQTSSLFVSLGKAQEGFLQLSVVDSCP